MSLVVGDSRNYPGFAVVGMFVTFVFVQYAIHINNGINSLIADNTCCSVIRRTQG